MRQYGRVIGIGLESEAVARRRLSRWAGVEANDGLHGHGANRLSDPRKTSRVASRLNDEGVVRTGDSNPHFHTENGF